LFESARKGGELAYRILRGEGIVRARLTVEYEVSGAEHSVMGRSADLLFALALITSKWKLGPAERVLGATGILTPDGTVERVEHTAAKLAAAVDALRHSEGSTPALLFYPAADFGVVEAWRRDAELPAHIELRPVAHLDDALGHLGYSLEKVYLRNPFRGLQHFDYADHAVFFGRDTEVREVVELLLRREEKGSSGLLVEGASGSGKSSFLRAGVLPALVMPRCQLPQAQATLLERRVSVDVWRAIWRLSLVPGEVAQSALAHSIAETWGQFPEFGSAWYEGEATTLAELAAHRAERWPKTMRFVWLIDQFEELLMRGLPDRGLRRVSANAATGRRVDARRGPGPESSYRTGIFCEGGRRDLALRLDLFGHSGTTTYRCHRRGCRGTRTSVQRHRQDLSRQCHASLWTREGRKSGRNMKLRAPAAVAIIWTIQCPPGVSR
jgi:hypothetical protein